MSPHPQSKKAKAKKSKQAAQTKPQRAGQGERADSKKDAKKDSKREARLARQAEERRQRERKQRMRKLRAAAMVAVVVGLAAVAVWFVFQPDPELAGVERPRDLGGGHVANASYDSAAPTSGPHSAQSPSCGTYREGLELPLAVHALEHGVVVLWYQPDSPALADELDEIADRWDSHVIVAANPEIESPVVATAWNRRLAFDDADDPGIAEFVKTYRNRGPEKVDCPR